jgi:hypothetical protein
VLVLLRWLRQTLEGLASPGSLGRRPGASALVFRVQGKSGVPGDAVLTQELLQAEVFVLKLAIESSCGGMVPSLGLLLLVALFVRKDVLEKRQNLLSWTYTKVTHVIGIPIRLSAICVVWGWGQKNRDRGGTRDCGTGERVIAVKN